MSTETGSEYGAAMKGPCPEILDGDGIMVERPLSLATRPREGVFFPAGSLGHAETWLSALHARDIALVGGEPVVGSTGEALPHTYHVEPLVKPEGIEVSNGNRDVDVYVSLATIRAEEEVDRLDEGKPPRGVVRMREFESFKGDPKARYQAETSEARMRAKELREAGLL